MALNKFMHPRNPYKEKAPNFKALSLKYPEFAKCVFQDLKGKCHLDYKSPTSLRQLAIALLKEDFDLDVEMPLNRLIPTIPLRLNYILWIEDILKELAQVKGRGIDIGTGASCVYPLLGCKKNDWSFLASEVDETNFTMAEKNVQRNNMENKIKVKKVSGETALLELLEDETGDYDFCMCNPPFFADHMEAQAITSSRTDDRAEPTSVNTASVGESITEGGEVEFIRKIIVESVKLQDRIKIFTSMVGKKTNLPCVKKDLQDHKIPNYQSTEFCQGKTMRWGIAWTFDTNLSFPRSLFQESKKNKKLSAPLTYTVPQSAVDVYDVEHVADKLMGILKSLEIEYTKSDDSKAKRIHLKLTAYKNTWSHQRRKRREMKRQKEELKAVCTGRKEIGTEEQDDDNGKNKNVQEINVDDPSNKQINLKRKEAPSSDEHSPKKQKVEESLIPSDSDQGALKRKGAPGTEEHSSKKMKVGESLIPDGINSKNPSDQSGLKRKGAPTTEEHADKRQKVKETIGNSDREKKLRESKMTENQDNTTTKSEEAWKPRTSDSPVATSDSPVKARTSDSPVKEGDTDVFLIKCDLFITETEKVHIEMVYAEGQKDQMNQILQYIKNHIALP
ncbi:RNA N6-adenosine-methyltransferase mettl16-like [Saccostrea cucullata]|uniref:RNA N6-adenosine-methyltransferase mettl16-like n=1 Tax=Saccostrea cuccullata TaxID=36930 RepID=UPI002ED2EF01